MSCQYIEPPIYHLKCQVSLHSITPLRPPKHPGVWSILSNALLYSGLVITDGGLNR